MNRLRVLFLVALIASVSVGGARASLERGFSYSPSQLTIVDSLDYSYISLAGCAHIEEPGQPDLPVKALSYAIPLDRRVSGISVTVVDSQLIGLSKPVYPGQLPYFYLAEDTTTREFMEPDSTIYSSSELFPEVLATGGYEGYFAGLKIANLLVYPVRYIPAADTLILYTNFSISLQLEPTEDNSLHPEKRTAEGQQTYENLAKLLVENPEDVEGYIYRPQIVEDSSFGSLGAVTYLVITADSLKSQFQPLADWYIRKGINTRILGLSDIEDNYSGVDLQEKIRNCIRFYYGKLQTEAVLLGGRPEIVPHREWNRSTTMQFLVMWGLNLPTPTDLYYSALDGSWDLNGNGLYGDSCTIETPWGGIEESKLLDYYGEVWAGRVQVSTRAEVQTFIQKRLRYEQDPPVYDNGTGKDFLFLGAAIDIKPPEGIVVTSGGKIKEASVSELEEEVSRYKMYDYYYSGEINELISAYAAEEKLQGGFYGINHAGHGHWDYIEVKPDTSPHPQRLTIADLDELTNGPKYGVFSTIACVSAAFDTTSDKCFGEHWLSNPNGGGVAFVGHSRYGVGLGGYADTLDKKYMKYLFEGWPDHPYPVPRRIHGIGGIYGMAKNEYITRLPKPWQGLHSMFWNDYIYEVCNWTLLGDPAMPVWTSPPGSLQVSHPLYTFTQECSFPVNVSSDGSPVSGAWVYLYKDEDIYSKAPTDSSGDVNFIIHPQSPGSLYVTVTKTNRYIPEYIPYQGKATVFQDWSGELLICGDVTVDSGVTLTVQPNTTVKFASGAKLTVEGALVAQGTADSKITFTAVDTSHRWYGIEFIGESDDSSCVLKHCVIEWASIGVWCNNASPTLEHSLIQYCSVAGIQCDQASPVISNNTVKFCLDGAEFYSSNPVLKGNCFIDNEGIGLLLFNSCSNTDIIQDNYFNDNDFYGMWLEGHSKPTISRCEVKHNHSIGVFCYDHSSPTIDHCLILSNGGTGIYCSQHSSPICCYIPRAGGYPEGGYNQIIDNGGSGVYACSSSYPYLGLSGKLYPHPYPGYNSIYANAVYQVSNGNSSGWIRAQLNFWGYPLSQHPDSSDFSGLVVWEPYLTSDPNGPPPVPSPLSEGDWTSPDATDPAQDLTQTAEGYQTQGLYEEAIAAYEQVVSNYPASRQAHWALDRIILCYQNLDREAEIVPYLEKVAAECADTGLKGFALEQSVYFLERRGEYGKALIRCNYLMGNYEGSTMRENLLFQKGLIYRYGLRDKGKAEEVFTQFLKDYPNSIRVPIVQIMLGQSVSPPLPKQTTEKVKLPMEFSLAQNYPNPFNPITQINYALPEDCWVKLEVFNILGRKIATLVDGEQKAGYKTVSWDASQMASGIYFYRLKAGGYIRAKKMILLK